jgi:putative ABC transport system substrate-binding protein
MTRRKLILGFGATLAVPLLARAQQAMPVIGFLNSASSDGYGPMAAAFRQGLAETGYVESQNVAIEYRWANSRTDSLQSLADDLVRRQVAVIFANGPAVRPAKAATTTIPVVFTTGIDPVEGGLVDQLSRPGGNLTGFSLFSSELGLKRLELMREAVPSKLLAVLVNPTNPRLEIDTGNIRKHGDALGHRLLFLEARNELQLEGAFARLAQEGSAPLLISSDPFFTDRIDRLSALAIKYRVAASYAFREFAKAGGLISYGTDLREVFRQSGIYAGRILKGARISDLPVQQPSKFELVVNLKTAKAIGVTIPPAILLRADEVIE